MMLWQHFTVSGILAIIMYPIFGFVSLFVFVGGYLVDIDHVLYYLYRFKSLNIKKTYKFYRSMCISANRRKYREIVLIFHNVETLAILLVLSLFSKIFLIIFIGLFVHLGMDAVDRQKNFKRIYGYSLLLQLKQKAL